MKITAAIVLLAGFAFVAGSIPAAEPTSPPQDAPAQSAPSKPKSQRKDRSPSQGRPNKEEWEKRREELRKLPPEERRAKIREWRLQRPANRPEIKNLSPEERETQRREMQQNLDSQITRLRKLQETRPLSEFETRMLKRMEELDRRFKSRPSRPSPKPRREDAPQKE